MSFVDIRLENSYLDVKISPFYVFGYSIILSGNNSTFWLCFFQSCHLLTVISCSTSFPLLNLLYFAALLLSVCVIQRIDGPEVNRNDSLVMSSFILSISFAALSSISHLAE